MREEDMLAGESSGRDAEEGDDGGSFERNLVFVCVPLGVEAAQPAFAAIAAECGRLGLRAVGLVPNPAGGPVVRQITGLIRRAEFLICDLTGEPPNVCYALGYAHGVGNEMSDVLLVAADASPLAFDWLPLPVRRYRSLEHLQSIVAAGLADLMQQTRR